MQKIFTLDIRFPNNIRKGSDAWKTALNVFQDRAVKGEMIALNTTVNKGFKKKSPTTPKTSTTSGRSRY